MARSRENFTLPFYLSYDAKWPMYLNKRWAYKVLLFSVSAINIRIYIRVLVAVLNTVFSNTGMYITIGVVTCPQVKPDVCRTAAIITVYCVVSGHNVETAVVPNTVFYSAVDITVDKFSF